MTPKRWDVLSICVYVVPIVTFSVLTYREATAGNVLFAAASALTACLAFVSLALNASTAIIRGETRGRIEARHDRLDVLERQAKETKANESVLSALTAATHRAAAAGKHADIERLFEQWRKQNDDALAATLRDMEALTRTVGQS